MEVALGIIRTICLVGINFESISMVNFGANEISKVSSDIISAISLATSFITGGCKAIESDPGLLILK